MITSKQFFMKIYLKNLIFYVKIKKIKNYNLPSFSLNNFFEGKMKKVEIFVSLFKNYNIAYLIFKSFGILSIINKNYTSFINPSYFFNSCIMNKLYYMPISSYP